MGQVVNSSRSLTNLMSRRPPWFTLKEDLVTHHATSGRQKDFYQFRTSPYQPLSSKWGRAVEDCLPNLVDIH